MDENALKDRLLAAAATWRETTREPLPRMAPGAPEAQLREFELALVEMLGRDATPRSAPEVADRTWGLVHDRPDDDPVKRRVVALHGELLRLRQDVA